MHREVITGVRNNSFLSVWDDQRVQQRGIDEKLIQHGLGCTPLQLSISVLIEEAESLCHPQKV